MPGTLYSADGLLEQGILALYRQWNSLPRRSTLPALDRLRRELADKLAALPQPVDQRTYVQELAGFAQQVLALPGIAGSEAAGYFDQLRTLRTPLLPDASPARIQALCSLLRATDPLVTAVDRLAWNDWRAAQDWEAIWRVLQPDLDQFAPAVSAQLQAIDAQRLAAAAAAKNEVQWQQANAAALRALEQVSDAVRAAGAAFVERKTPSPLSPPREAASMAHGKDVEPAGPAAPVSSELAAPEAVQFFTDIRFPLKVKTGDVNWLKVRLTLQEALESLVEAKAEVVFANPVEYVDVRVTAPDFTEDTGAWERTIAVYPDKDSQPAVFLLKAGSVGRRRIAVDFYHKGRMIAGVAFKTDVDAQYTVPSGEPAALERSPSFAPMVDNPPPPADLELRVVKTNDANRLAVMLHSERADVPFRWQPMGEINLAARDPADFLASTLDRLSDLAAGAADLTPDQQQAVEAEIVRTGEGLFEQLMPAPLQDAYWKVIQPLRAAGKISTLLITTDEPWIPWELIKPYRFNAFCNEEEKDEFLVEGFTLCRWLAGRGPAASVTVQTAALVMPELDLSYVQQEKTFLEQWAAGQHVACGAPLQHRGDVLNLLANGDFQVLHVATHGSFNRDDPDQSVLELADGDTLKPVDLQGSGSSGLRRSRPLVFLNACYGGRLAFGLTGLGGWADRLFYDANTSAFVGALWEVNDELAVAFSQTYYSNLAAGKTLGEALRLARLKVRDLNPANPTWLAYTLYGDPNAVVKFGS